VAGWWRLIGSVDLRTLLRQLVPSTPPGNGRLLGLFFGALLGPEACIAVVEEARTCAEVTLTSPTRGSVARDSLAQAS